MLEMVRLANDGGVAGSAARREEGGREGRRRQKEDAIKVFRGSAGAIHTVQIYTQVLEKTSGLFLLRIAYGASFSVYPPLPPFLFSSMLSPQAPPPLGLTPT